ncbi:NAD(P)-dependent dehydrogenase, short-chain alcohol dehydrogenase family [Burkholderia sp. GAS332]|nr:NAD(P)-dependent dehydrogenase, short-chain alcohol dehydrogenase family [Burkholderia sp. GAS332]
MSFIDREAADAQMSLHGRQVLITGASLGIGRAIARLFAWRGARLALHYSSAADARVGLPDAAQQLAAELQTAGAQAVALECDLNCADAGHRLVQASADKIGLPDVVVLCASAQVRQRFDQITIETMRHLSRINLEASLEILQDVLPSMRSRGWGRVISIGSVNQVRPDAELGVYAALKAAHHNLIVNAAKECAADAVTLNTISPGLIATPRNAWRREDSDAWRQIEHNANPMRRAGMPEEVAHLALLLASDAGAFITGADIPVDGGGRL